MKRAPDAADSVYGIHTPTGDEKTDKAHLCALIGAWFVHMLDHPGRAREFQLSPQTGPDAGTVVKFVAKFDEASGYFIGRVTQTGESID